MKQVWFATVVGTSIIMALVAVQGVRSGGGTAAGYVIATVLAAMVTFVSAYVTARLLDRSGK